MQVKDLNTSNTMIKNTKIQVQKMNRNQCAKNEEPIVDILHYQIINADASMCNEFFIDV